MVAAVKPVPGSSIRPTDRTDRYDSSVLCRVRWKDPDRWSRWSVRAYLDRTAAEAHYRRQELRGFAVELWVAQQPVTQVLTERCEVDRNQLDAYLAERSEGTNRSEAA